MIYVFENQNNMASVVYDESTLSDLLKSKGIAVASLPEVTEQAGKVAVLKCKKSTGKVWFDYVDEPISETDRIASLEDAVAALVLGV